ncbi:hypothetical protein Kpol_1019p11 [Vanderwaltozyma polyspora DSM 70294]|uniref:Kinesin motor domain-containing protein n=1 Tax=Vanderwaltozyma polyspora (strain ATCC 22028 / DSM 70294 / BCRC 21397 / CBS 2163 / NBRC 10782 / NRRL Y-8283 / UCD 57-17) TaxID=436907 RepID=A7TPA4_VANPO|nr:uncharacterized protein Kpol_1019p11 [Vanderwaltozyma polyspora DSM 70294]EDO15891.1 hypothetical protein Kpol_1019p11 [Vanderwaltozyma polyspora DSM 70294]
MWYSSSKNESIPDLLVKYTGYDEPQPMRVYLKLFRGPSSNSNVSFKIREGNSINFTDTQLTGFSKDQVVNTQYKFDKVFASNDTGVEHQEFIESNLESLLQGYNTSIVTYGQSGTGKSFELYGEQQDGLIFQLLTKLFNRIDEEMGNNNKNIHYTVKFSFLEVYQEKMFDLMDSPSVKKHLKINDSTYAMNGFQVENLRTTQVLTLEELKILINICLLNQKERHNNLIQRSHTIMEVSIEKRNKLDESITMSSLYIVDLAGSDPIGKNSSSGITTEDAKKINHQIKSVNDVINGLVVMNREGGIMTDISTLMHKVPYKSSILTRLLLDPLGGNCKTTFLLTSSLKKNDWNETLSTLKFGYNCKSANTNPRINRFGLNSKATMDIFLTDMKLKEDNFISITNNLTNQVNNLMTQANSLEDELKNNETKYNKKETNILKSQVETLTELLNNPNNRSQVDLRNQNENTEILTKLLEKCEHNASLELSLDDKMKEILILRRRESEYKARIASTETMNQHLLDRVTELELQMKSLLVGNSNFEIGIDNENMGQYSSLTPNSSFNTPTKHVSSKTSSTALTDSTLVRMSKDAGSMKSNWLFGSREKIWGTRKVSGSSIASADSSTTIQVPDSVDGVNLRVLKVAQRKKKIPEL